MSNRRYSFTIAIVNHADRNEPSHWAPIVSVRRSRAIRQTLKLRREGNRFAMLFIVENATDEYRPIGTRHPSLDVAARVPRILDSQIRNHEGKTISEVTVDKIREGLFERF